MRISHVSWNFGGLALPLVIAALTVPHLLENLGAQRFGLLTLAWGAIGYSSAFDLGVGRALTQRLATLRSSASVDTSLITETVGTALRLTQGLGLIGALVIAIASIAGAGAFVNEGIARSEIAISGVLLAAALPMQAISGTYRGINEAYLNFRGISIVRFLLGAANFAVPYLISTQTSSLYWVIGSLVAARAIGLLVYRHLALQCLINAHGVSNGAYSKLVAAGLFGFGGWFALSNLLNSGLAVADRFILAATVSAVASSIYVIPYEIVVQSLIVVGALTTVAFPYLTRLSASNPERVKPTFYRVVVVAMAAMAAVMAAFWILGEFILSAWLGNGYVAQHGLIMKILSVGLVPYAVGTMCIAFLHAYGRTKLTAKINVLEFPVYAMLLFCMVSNFGVIGAALMWVIRVSVNAAILGSFCVRAR